MIPRGIHLAFTCSYDYTQAARDALHFAALFDRFIQNLRRFCGYDIQYFAAVEPQRRLAPHVHIAIRGTVSRAELREVLTASYRQVWWPSTKTVRFDGDHPASLGCPCPAALTPPLEMTQASGWPGTMLAVSAVPPWKPLRVAWVAWVVAINWLGGMRCGRTHSGMTTWTAAKKIGREH